MNQILYIQKEKRKGSTIEIHKIVLFFTISMIVFGVVMLGQGTYGAYKNNEMREIIENTAPVASIDREGSQLKIYASHIRPIEKIEYNWNNDEDTKETILGQGRNVITQRIELPAGNNKFNITLTDVNGKISNYTKEFYMENGKDITKPKIDMSVVGNYIKVTATDEKALSYLTYRWNEEDETRIEASIIDNKTIETSIEIKRGQNTLTVIGVDSSNNTTTREQMFEGRVKPTVDLFIEGMELIVTAKHEGGIEKIDLTVNGVTNTIDNPEKTPEMVYKYQMPSGYSLVNVTAYSTENTQESYEGQCTL